MIVDMNAPSSSLARSACRRVNTAYRPSTRSAHRTHLRTYLSFVVFMDLPLRFTIHSVLAFLEFLYVNNISHRFILKYVASLRTLANRYDWGSTVLSYQLVLSYLRSISRNSCFNPPSRGIFSLHLLSSISKACTILTDPPPPFSSCFPPCIFHLFKDVQYSASFKSSL